MFHPSVNGVAAYCFLAVNKEIAHPLFAQLLFLSLFTCRASRVAWGDVAEWEDSTPCPPTHLPSCQAMPLASLPRDDVGAALNCVENSPLALDSEILF